MGRLQISCLHVFHCDFFFFLTNAPRLFGSDFFFKFFPPTPFFFFKKKEEGEAVQIVSHRAIAGVAGGVLPAWLSLIHETR